jgi:hypothetical protein
VPTLPTSLLVKGSNFPPGWVTFGTFGYDAFVSWLDPQPTAYPSGIIVGGVMSGTVAITLTSAQLLALAATPIQLLNAPPTPPKGFGTAMVINPTALFADYVFGGTAYTLGNADNVVRVEYTGQAASLIQAPANGLLTAAVNTFSSNVQQPTQNIARTVGANLGLELKVTGTTPGLTLGNGTLTVTLKFDLYVLI